jgi:hypothetical protein
MPIRCQRLRRVYNLTLSQKRADSVKAWLVNKGGVKGKKLAAKGREEAKPVAPNINPDGSDNPEGRQKNRRVKVTVKKPGAAASLGTLPVARPVHSGSNLDYLINRLESTNGKSNAFSKPWSARASA